MPQFVYALIHWWTFGSFPSFSYCIWCFSEPSWTRIFWVPVFHSLGYISHSRIVGSSGNPMFNIWRNHHTVFHRHDIILHPTNGAQGFWLPFHFVSFCFVLICSHPSRYKVVGIWWWFWFALSSGWKCWSSFHMLVGCMHIFSGEIPVEVLCPFFWLSWACPFLYLGLKF